MIKRVYSKRYNSSCAEGQQAPCLKVKRPGRACGLAPDPQGAHQKVAHAKLTFACATARTTSFQSLPSPSGRSCTICRSARPLSSARWPCSPRRRSVSRSGRSGRPWCRPSAPGAPRASRWSRSRRCFRTSFRRSPTATRFASTGVKPGAVKPRPTLSAGWNSKGSGPRAISFLGCPTLALPNAVREMRIYVNTEKRINVNTARAQRPGYPDGTSRYLLHASAVDDTARDSLSQ